MRDSGGSILCRVRTMVSDDYLNLLSDAGLSGEQIRIIIEYFQPKQLLNLPTYNQYFYIQSEASDNTADNTALVGESQEQQVFVTG